jgi:hypothetical protein
VLAGAVDEVEGGVLQMGNVSAVYGDWNLGVFGNVGDIRGSGVTVVPQSELDTKCELFRPMFESIVGKDGVDAASVGGVESLRY